jgi:hypothetical protein
MEVEVIREKITIQKYAGTLTFQTLKMPQNLGCSRLSFMPEEVLPLQNSLISYLSPTSIPCIKWQDTLPCQIQYHKRSFRTLQD